MSRRGMPAGTRRPRRPGQRADSRLVLRRHAAQILAAGVRAADPERVVRQNIAVAPRGLEIAGERFPSPRGRIVCLAVGKAAYRMATAAADVLGDHLDTVVAVGPDGDAGPLASLPRVHVRPASHPLPDERGLAAAEEAERLALDLGIEDFLLVLLSGGASALLPLPAKGIRLEDKARTTALLLRSGATIAEINTVRRHLSRLKGGGLARAAAPARVVALALSDVIGDDLATIASGPCSPDPTTFGDSVSVLRSRGVWSKVPAPVRRHLEAGQAGHLPETPKPGAALFRRVHSAVIGSNRQSLSACAEEAAALGYRPLILTSRLAGEAREVARVLVSILRECASSGTPAQAPVCLLAGGETTVTVRGDGFGGRNQEMATAAAIGLDGFPVPALGAFLGTDGIDGRSDAAGGAVDDQTVARARELGLAPPEEFLAVSDSRSFLGPVGGLIHTGPTGTNVADLSLLLIGRTKRLAIARKSL